MFHLPIGLPLYKAVRVILQALAINLWGILSSYTGHNLQQRDVHITIMLSRRSLLKIREGTFPKTDLREI